VVIDVHVAGASFPDLLMTRGQYQLRPELPFVPGYEVAGTVRAAPPDANLEPGARVAAVTVIGGYAERAVAPAFATYRLPDRLTFAQGAGLALNYHTAYFALVLRGRLQEGETVLIHGAAGGVGTAALGVAQALGARTLAVVSSSEKEAFARQAGAEHVLRSDQEWRAQARALTNGRGVDVVLDPVGGDRFTDSVRSLAETGRVVVVGFTDGSIPQVKVNRLLLTNTAVVGAAWWEHVREHPAEGREIAKAVDRLLDRAGVVPIVGARFSLEDGVDALRLIDQRRALGKIVIEVQS
jgi:NADPH2:quinone reductase